MNGPVGASATFLDETGAPNHTIATPSFVADRAGVYDLALTVADTVREIHRWGCDLRYPFFSLQSGKDNIGWGVPRWSLRAEPPRVSRGIRVPFDYTDVFDAMDVYPVDDPVNQSGTAAASAPISPRPFLKPLCQIPPPSRSSLASLISRISATARR